MSLSKKSNLDALMISAAHVLIDDTADYMRSIDTSDTVISKKLDKRIHRFIRQNTAGNDWSTVLVWVKKAVAAVLVFCTISFAACMSVEAVREDIWDTILEWYDEFVAVFYVTDSTTPNVIEEFREPTLQPAGTERIVEIQADTLNQIKYIIDDNLVMVYYQRVITAGSIYLDAEHGCVKEMVNINSYEGQLFIYDDGRRTLIWHDGDYVYVMLLYMDIESDMLIQLAESVR